MLAPITPPPMITTSAEVGTVRKAEEDNGPRSHPWAARGTGYADGSVRPAGGGGWSVRGGCRGAICHLCSASSCSNPTVDVYQRLMLLIFYDH